jgi:hypothetical protein
MVQRAASDARGWSAHGASRAWTSTMARENLSSAQRTVTSHKRDLTSFYIIGGCVVAACARLFYPAPGGGSARINPQSRGGQGGIKAGPGRCRWGPVGGTPDSRLDAPLALGDGAEKLAHKSPTEVARGLGAACPCKLRRAILEFASSRRAEPLLPQLIPQPCASRDGRQHGEQDQGARARPALASRCLGYNPPWSRRQHLVNTCWLRSAAASDVLAQHPCSA